MIDRTGTTCCQARLAPQVAIPVTILAAVNPSNGVKLRQGNPVTHSTVDRATTITRYKR
jgi:hypothetical protein